MVAMCPSLIVIFLAFACQKEGLVPEDVLMEVSPRRNTGPGMSEGALSARFPEISVTITSGFAHDSGMTSSISSLSVGGEACSSAAVLQKLVALRGGWTRDGGQSDADALQVFEQFVEDWAALTPYGTRVTAEAVPPHMGRPVDPSVPAYHPPRIGLHTPKDGQPVVYHAYFQSWDAGNHGRLYDYRIEAYRVRDGAAVTLERLF